MTMLTLVGPQLAQSLQLTFSFKCEALQVHQNTRRQIWAQRALDNYLEDRSFAKPSTTFGTGWQARHCAVPIAPPGSAAFTICAQQGSQPCP